MDLRYRRKKIKQVPRELNSLWVPDSFSFIYSFIFSHILRPLQQHPLPTNSLAYRVGQWITKMEKQVVNDILWF